ncbi:MAG: YlbF family regulator, partial [Peptococcaceae bacterium]|nr:YlbF family regulator [Peptococcaceae bacterium]
MFINFNGGEIVEIFAKAIDLADALAASAELAALKEAEMRMMMDSDARAFVEEYQMIQQ